jgi:hypothetical protein
LFIRWSEAPGFVRLDIDMRTPTTDQAYASASVIERPDDRAACSGDIVRTAARNFPRCRYFAGRRSMVSLFVLTAAPPAPASAR